jgi:hypothetical protein
MSIGACSERNDFTSLRELKDLMEIDQLNACLGQAD